VGRTLRALARAPASLAVLALRAYKLCLSPLIPPACRFEPTCSEYAREAIETHGVARGAWLGARRLARCHPWGGHGFDPVPAPRRRRSPGDARSDAGTRELRGDGVGREVDLKNAKEMKAPRCTSSS